MLRHSRSRAAIHICLGCCRKNKEYSYESARGQDSLILGIRLIRASHGAEAELAVLKDSPKGKIVEQERIWGPQGS